MRLSAQEEYGLRCLLQIARTGPGGSMTIPEIARAEGLSHHNVAKLTRVLRRGGLVKSRRGQAGGYELARPAQEILIGDALGALGGRMFEPAFCERFTGVQSLCTHSVNCSIRSLWKIVQSAVDEALGGVTLADLIASEQAATVRISSRVPVRLRRSVRA